MKKGNYTDEKLIRLRRFYRQRVITQDPFTEELSIGGKGIRFSPRMLFGGRVRIWLPDDFTDMPEPIAKVRYLSSYRPPVILTNTNYNVNYGFHLMGTGEIGGNAEIDEWIDRMLRTVLFHAPGTVVYGKGILPVDGGEGRWFEYKNFTLDEETYHLQFLAREEESLLAGTFNCTMRCYDQWKGPVLKTLESIAFKKKGDQDDESR